MVPDIIPIDGLDANSTGNLLHISSDPGFPDILGLGNMVGPDVILGNQFLHIDFIVFLYIYHQESLGR